MLLVQETHLKLNWFLFSLSLSIIFFLTKYFKPRVLFLVPCCLLYAQGMGGWSQAVSLQNPGQQFWLHKPSVIISTDYCGVHSRSIHWVPGHVNPHVIFIATLHLILLRRKLDPERASNWLEITQHQVARPEFGPWWSGARYHTLSHRLVCLRMRLDRSLSPILETG